MRNLFLSISLLFVACAQAADRAATHPAINPEMSPLFPFRLGADPFDDTMIDYGAKHIQHIIQTAALSNDNSDLVKLFTKMSEKDLNGQLQDPTIKFLAENIYHTIQHNERIKIAFSKAQELTKKNEPLEQRAKSWVDFRSTGAHELAALRNQSIPSIQDPTPRSPHAIIELIERNKNVTLTEEQQQIYIACSVVLYSFRQNHRLIDLETDNPNFLFQPKK